MDDFLIVCDKNSEMSVELISWGIKEWKYKEKNYELCELEGQTSDVYVISDSKLILNEPWKKK